MSNIRFFASLIVMLFVLCTKSQIISRRQSDTLPLSYMIDPKKVRAELLKNIPSIYNSGIDQRFAYHFCHAVSIQVSEQLWDGTIYTDWPELESYLNKILHAILPEELAHDSSIHVYIIQDGQMNAFMDPSGRFYMTIGLLAELRNESMIAGIMAHEVAHYYLKHSIHSYIAEERGQFDMGLFNPSRRLYYNHSVKSEMACDSMAIQWINRTDYSLDGLQEAFEVFQRHERNRLKKSRLDWKVEKTTHPLTEDRLVAITRLKEKCLAKTRFENLIAPDKLEPFRNEIKKEVLNYFMKNFNYDLALEKAFQFHLFDPDNTSYLFAILEGIRRYCYLDPSRWTKNFITNFYYDSVNVEGIKHKEKKESHLFEKFDFDILPINPKEGPKIKTKFYWKDAPRFATYEEAFNFYYKVCRKLELSESILVNALSYVDSLYLRDRYLKEYLSRSDIQHRAFAQALLDGTIYNLLPQKKLFVFHRFNVNVRQSKQDIPFVSSDFYPDDPMRSVIDSLVAGKPDRVPIYLPSLKAYNLNRFRALIALEQFSFFRILSRGEKTELQLLAPEYWELMNEYSVNEIEFINCQYFESFPKGFTLENYQQLCDLTYDELFSNVKSDKYYSAFHSSVRIIKGALMKIRYVSPETKLNISKGTKAAIIQALRADVKEKSVIAKKLDYQKHLREK